MFYSRFQQIMVNDEPKFVPLSPDTPDRWADERQYLTSDVHRALAAFRRWRDENLTVLKKLRPEHWQRAGLHPTRGRMTAEDIVTLMAWHDDNHLGQLKRAMKDMV
jgi:hypothetical protein